MVTIPNPNESGIVTIRNPNESGIRSSFWESWIVTIQNPNESQIATNQNQSEFGVRSYLCRLASSPSKIQLAPPANGTRILFIPNYNYASYPLSMLCAAINHSNVWFETLPERKRNEIFSWCKWLYALGSSVVTSPLDWRLPSRSGTSEPYWKSLRLNDGNQYADNHLITPLHV